MTQLKTLKELAFGWNWYQKTRDRDNTIRDLRQEAIKWIKELERLRVSGEPQPTAKKWVKDFFNISAEDLK